MHVARTSDNASSWGERGVEGKRGLGGSGVKRSHTSCRLRAEPLLAASLVLSLFRFIIPATEAIKDQRASP